MRETLKVAIGTSILVATVILVFILFCSISSALGATPEDERDITSPLMQVPQNSPASPPKAPPSFRPLKLEDIPEAMMTDEELLAEAEALALLHSTRTPLRRTDRK